MAKCGLPCDVYSRCVGYFSVVNKTWNKGKKEEFKDRKYYDINKAMQRFQDRNAQKTA